MPKTSQKPQMEQQGWYNPDAGDPDLIGGAHSGHPPTSSSGAPAPPAATEDTPVVDDIMTEQTQPSAAKESVISVSEDKAAAGAEGAPELPVADAAV